MLAERAAEAILVKDEYRVVVCDDPDGLHGITDGIDVIAEVETPDDNGVTAQFELREGIIQVDFYTSDRRDSRGTRKSHRKVLV